MSPSYYALLKLKEYLKKQEKSCVDSLIQSAERDDLNRGSINTIREIIIKINEFEKEGEELEDEYESS